MWYNRDAFTAPEDRATLGSDLSADAGLAKGDKSPNGIGVALWKTKAINPFRTFLKSLVVHFIYLPTAIFIDWFWRFWLQAFPSNGNELVTAYFLRPVIRNQGTWGKVL